MKKIININLAGRLIPIEDSAYEILNQYLNSLKKYFSKEEGGDEIVADIESRIAELFQDKLKKGAHCITDEDVNTVKTSMGTPEQFDESGSTSNAKEEATSGNTEEPYNPRPRKRLYRDPENKVVSGVCSGLGAYFNIDPVVFRIIFALLAIGGFGSGVLVYFILWVATPTADTAAEKLEMRGERVDLNSIKNTIQDEINQMKNQAKNVGNDIRNFSQGRGKQIGSEFERVFTGVASGVGSILVFVTKGFFYFFAAVVLFCLVIVAITMAVSSAALFPWKDLLLHGTIQNTLIWPAIGLLIGIPILSLIIFIVRKLTGINETSRYVGYTLSFLWFLGLAFAGIVAISMVKDWRRETTETTSVFIQQPSNGKLILKKAPGTLLTDWDNDWHINFFNNKMLVDDDTIVINRIRIRVEKSPDANFHADILKYSAGRNIQQARNFANDIEFSITQKDSIIYIPEGFTLPLHSTFRGQGVTLVIQVPNGKFLEADREVTHNYDFRRSGRGYNANWDDDSYYDGEPVKLKMTNDGVKNENEPVKQSDTTSHEKKDSTASEKGYRYKGPAATNVKKTVKITMSADRLITLISPTLYKIVNG
ncbi:PspC domain-containing protein [Chitinophaga silvatica]|uniref:PspC domain-containing protein n=1 Tax=Chitinophaga silvatica TaxID=2282649 RepID=A0A3E1YBJ4_9BACT|nr:PspC domain-containing protein [Chitinophaga silvatica]RFS23380.1 PspC domain-containing protein [Chitinophaga silvatica]